MKLFNKLDKVKLFLQQEKSKSAVNIIETSQNLISNRPKLMRLEPRLMFDGAAAETTVDV